MEMVQYPRKRCNIKENGGVCKENPSEPYSGRIIFVASFENLEYLFELYYDKSHQRPPPKPAVVSI